MAVAIFLTGDLLRECALSSRTSAFDQERRLRRLTRLVAITHLSRRDWGISIDGARASRVGLAHEDQEPFCLPGSTSGMMPWPAAALLSRSARLGLAGRRDALAAQIACKEKPRLSRGFGGSPFQRVEARPVTCAQGESNGLRCALSALPSPGSLVLVQTAQVVTETLVPARTVHPQVDVEVS
jgi:hypothetical protein